MDSKTVVLAGTGDIRPSFWLRRHLCYFTGSSYTVNGVMDKMIPSTSASTIYSLYRDGDGVVGLYQRSKVHDYFLRNTAMGTTVMIGKNMLLSSRPVLSRGTSAAAY
jgi:hypothetical protein